MVDYNYLFATNQEIPSRLFDLIKSLKTCNKQIKPNKCLGIGSSMWQILKIISYLTRCFRLKKIMILKIWKNARKELLLTSVDKSFWQMIIEINMEPRPFLTLCRSDTRAKCYQIRSKEQRIKSDKIRST